MENNEKDVSIKEIMTASVITVLPNTPLLDVAKILGEHKFDGVPVTEIDGTLIGVINEFDLIKKGSAVHLPTLRTVFQNLSFLKEDKEITEAQFKKIFNLRAEDVMNTEPLTFSEDSTLDDAVKLFAEHHGVNPVPVVNSDSKVVGIVSRYDILKMFRVLRGE